MNPVHGGRPEAWVDAGRQIAPTLGSYSAAVVSSSDPVAAAHVALGIGRAEEKKRRVVVADLVGDLSPLRALVEDDDPHGISDSFLYGVSLNRIDRLVAGTENLHVMPSGTESVIDREIFASPRWKQIGEQFTESGALLLLVTRSDSPGLAELIDQLDGAVVVKDSDIPGAPSALVLARVSSPTPTLKVLLPGLRSLSRGGSRPRWLYSAAGAVAVATLVIAVTFAMMRGREGDAVPARPHRAATTSLPAASAPPAPTVFVAPASNVTDSSRAAAFAVELLVANTPEGANFVLRRDAVVLPSATVVPVPIGPERMVWYKVISGAYTSRYQADSLLLTLRRSKVLSDSAGSVLRVPLALLLDSVSSQGGIEEATRSVVAKYIARGVPAYALMQDDGDALIYAGAFDAAAQSAEMLKTLRGAGLMPVLVYRTGRSP